MTTCNILYKTTNYLSRPRNMTWCWTFRRQRMNGYRGRITMLATKNDAYFGLKHMMRATRYLKYLGSSRRPMSVRYTCHVQSFPQFTLMWCAEHRLEALYWWVCHLPLAGVVSADILEIGVTGHSIRWCLVIAVLHLMFMTSLWGS